MSDSLHKHFDPERFSERPLKPLIGLFSVYSNMGNITESERCIKILEANFDSMPLPFQVAYVSNLGNYYTKIKDFDKALKAYQRQEQVMNGQRGQEINGLLCKANKSMVYNELGLFDLAETELSQCASVVLSLGVPEITCFIHTQQAVLAIAKNNLSLAGNLLNDSIDFSQISNDTRFSRYKALQRYYEQMGKEREAARYAALYTSGTDSVRNEEVQMRVEESEMRFRQDTVLLHRNLRIAIQDKQVQELQMTFIILLALVFIAILAIIIYLLNRRHKTALREAEANARLMALRMENIRNRISPHFLFNVLNRELNNSVIQQNEIMDIVSLLRRNLELAERFSVSLGEELEFVNLYVSIEKRSLGPQFLFDIKIAEGIDISKTVLPAMMVEILVENAIKHGLRAKTGDKKLVIDVSSSSGATLIVVRNNGGGFNPSSSSRGTGTGLRVISQTLQLLNAKNDTPIAFDIHDCVWPDGEGGCEATIVIPDNYNFDLPAL